MSTGRLRRPPRAGWRRRGRGRARRHGRRRTGGPGGGSGSRRAWLLSEPRFLLFDDGRVELPEQGLRLRQRLSRLRGDGAPAGGLGGPFVAQEAVEVPAGGGGVGGGGGGGGGGDGGG